MTQNRREFVKGLAAAATGAAVLSAQRPSGPPAHIDVVINEPIATIRPEIYGHFIEHLGGVIYDGVWVGEGSAVPNTHGIRTPVIDALRAIKAPVVRWPGGCFADSYDWRDGIGPESARNPRTNFWGGTDPNSFGTQEFMRFCDLAGAKPYFAANLRSLPAKDFYEWVEYVNSPAGSTLGAKRRAEQGHPEPYGVHYWGIGNESWGCGGNFTPEDYASEFRRFTAWVPSYGERPALIASGPNEHDLDWTRRLMRSMAEKRQVQSIYGLSTHYYTWNLSAGKTTNWFEGKRDALRFGPLEWYELLSQGSYMETIVNDTWGALAESDPRHHVKLIVDEWGAWYAPGTEIGKKYILSQMPTLRDALLSGLTLDIFNRHADKVAMANAAQLINCLHSLMLASGDHFVLTTNYYVFKMYMPHMGAQAVRAEFAAPSVRYDRNGTPAMLWSLRGSASVNGKELTLTVVNSSLDEAFDTEIVIRGATAASATGMVLTNADPHAHNDFEHPGVVEPAKVSVDVRGGRIVHQFPSKSVTALQVTLA